MNCSPFQCIIVDFVKPSSHVQIAQSTANMVQFAKIMEYPIAVTEQYFRGLGKTIEELADAREFVLSDKTQFSMMTPEVTAFMEEHKPR